MFTLASKAFAQGATKTYATWNPSDKGANITLSNGNLTASQTLAGSVRSTISKSSDKWYWEVTVDSVSGNYPAIGIGNSSAILTNYPGGNTNSIGVLRNRSIQYNGATIGTISATIAVGGVFGFALDATNQTLYIYYAGALQYTVLISSYMPAGALFAMVGAWAYTVSTTANFGATTLTYTPPAGYNAGLYT